MNGSLARVSEILARRSWRLAIAESCTGGLLAARFTDRPGASRFLDTGFITYSDEAKVRLLGVRRATLAQHGAVSEAVVTEMLSGALRAAEADSALAVTGIAGPAGGSEEKPVGTVWIGAAVGERVRVRRYRFDGDRARIREASVAEAVALLETLLEGT